MERINKELFCTLVSAFENKIRKIKLCFLFVRGREKNLLEYILLAKLVMSWSQISVFSGKM